MLIHLLLVTTITSTHVVSTHRKNENLKRYLLDSSPPHWSSWEQYAACQLTCVSGYETQTQDCCTTGNNFKCLTLPWDTLKSLVGTCPVDGQWDHWSAFGRCSVTCGQGTHTRTRVCVFDPNAPHGNDCAGSATETGSCQSGVCPVDGVWSFWGAWSKCSVTCNLGQRQRSRRCEYPPHAPRGHDCVGMATEAEFCSNGFCAVDGVWNIWTSWSPCPVTCGGGEQNRSRSCDFPADKPRGHDCVGDSQQTQHCNENLCPVDGVWSDWTSWTSCPVTCGDGSKNRTRTCDFPANLPHGNNCTGDSQQSRVCSSNPCPVDGVWTSWTSWSPCPVTCGGGQHNRSRLCGFPADKPQGQDCVGDSQQTQHCNQNPCPVNGVWSPWTQWSVCSVTCDTGQSTRTRQCQFDLNKPHGAFCFGQSQDRRTCNTQLCPGDGVWSAWGAWSSCSVTCGAGHALRTRTCLFTPNEPHGAFCNGLSRSMKTCTETNCQVDGVLSIWSDWTACTVSCGGGQQNRTRTCDFPASGAPHGRDCVGDLHQTQACNNEMCPVDGHWSAWTDWSVCSQTCGNGTQERWRTCGFDHLAPHGHSCPGFSKLTRKCAFDPCPRRCYVCTDPQNNHCGYSYTSQECNVNQTYCINDVQNWSSGNKQITRRCGTFEDCKSGWLDKYSQLDHCVGYNERYIYVAYFTCSFCCHGDNCNKDYNPAVKCSPP